MQAYCAQCKFEFDVADAGESRVKCVVCGRPCEVTDASGAPVKRKKKKLAEGEHRCDGCGKVLGKGVTYCVACGTHNYDVGKIGATLAKADKAKSDTEEEIIKWRFLRALGFFRWF
jgi:hypothetical protein